MSVIDGQLANAATFNAAFGSKQADNTFTGKQTLARAGSGATVLDEQQAINDLIASDALKIPLSEKGAPLGVVPLNALSQIDSTYLPSYVDDILEFSNFPSLPLLGESGKIYVTTDNGNTYRWTGSVYAFLGQPIANSDDLNEGSVNLYFTPQRVNDEVDSFATDNTSGSLVTLAVPTKGIIELINAGLVSIEGITAPASTKKFCLINKTGASIILKNEAGTAANRIKTGTGADITIEDEQMFLFAYSSNSSRWFIAGGSGGSGSSELVKEEPTGVVDGVNDLFTFSGKAIDSASVWVFVDGVYRLSGYTFTQGLVQSTIQFTVDVPVIGQTVEIHYFKTLSTPAISNALVPSGSLASPNIITAAGGVSSTSDQRQYQFVISSGGAVVVTANPQVSAGTIVGQELIIEGTSDTDYITLNDGTGLSLNGSIDLKNRKKLFLVWNGAD